MILQGIPSYYHRSVAQRSTPVKRAQPHLTSITFFRHSRHPQVLRMGWDYGERLPSLQLTVHDR